MDEVVAVEVRSRSDGKNIGAANAGEGWPRDFSKVGPEFAEENVPIIEAMFRAGQFSAANGVATYNLAAACDVLQTEVWRVAVKGRGINN
ncbi:hypothetical protein CUD01_20250 [Cellulomonas uda]|uniref:Uncharacterized protein n=1 Tax=Cellulomonas uda TaxID=1714 RepID=A0A4Y3KAR1_CELUD|nr:hypothetical protein CUD01_20250 [Cellulomonas uda]